MMRKVLRDEYEYSKPLPMFGGRGAQLLIVDMERNDANFLSESSPSHRE
jgi:hypothetical protein